jgi:hypothetical protein
MADIQRRGMQQRCRHPDQIAVFDGALAGHRPDGQMIPVITDIGKFRHPVQVDQDRRPAQPEIHDRHEALPPASTRASGACWASNATASARLPGAT